MSTCVRLCSDRYLQQCMLGHLTSIVCMLHAGQPHEVQGPGGIVHRTDAASGTFV